MTTRRRLAQTLRPLPCSPMARLGGALGSDRCAMAVRVWPQAVGCTARAQATCQPHPGGTEWAAIGAHEIRLGWWHVNAWLTCVPIVCTSQEQYYTLFRVATRNLFYDRRPITTTKVHVEHPSTAESGCLADDEKRRRCRSRSTALRPGGTARPFRTTGATAQGRDPPRIVPFCGTPSAACRSSSRKCAFRREMRGCTASARLESLMGGSRHHVRVCHAFGRAIRRV